MEKALDKQLQELVSVTREVIQHGSVVKAKLPMARHFEVSLMELRPADFLPQLEEVMEQMFTADQALIYAKVAAMAEPQRAEATDRAVFDLVENVLKAAKLRSEWREYLRVIMSVSVAIEGQEQSYGGRARSELYAEHHAEPEGPEE